MNCHQADALLKTSGNSWWPFLDDPTLMCLDFLLMVRAFSSPPDNSLTSVGLLKKRHVSLNAHTQATIQDAKPETVCIHADYLHELAAMMQAILLFGWRLHTDSCKMPSLILKEQIYIKVHLSQSRQNGLRGSACSELGALYCCLQLSLMLLVDGEAKI